MHSFNELHPHSVVVGLGGGGQIWLLVREEIRKQLEIMLYFGDMRETNADKHTNCATILAFGLFDQMSPQETSKLSEETSVTVCNCGHFLGEFRFLEFTIDRYIGRFWQTISQQWVS
jgi:hypothetical protein